MAVLNKEFYERDTRVVARELLGKVIVRKLDGKILKGKIVETEAYLGEEDRASHARFGKTNRNYLMFEEAGRVYVYFIYGMYYCLNVTTEVKGKAGAVLIRGIEPLEETEVMKRNRKKAEIKRLTDGPGKICQAMQIDKSFNGEEIFDDNGILYIEQEEKYNFEIVESKRIGVKMDLDENMRYYIKNNKFVSKGS